MHLLFLTLHYHPLPHQPLFTVVLSSRFLYLLHSLHLPLPVSSTWFLTALSSHIQFIHPHPLLLSASTLPHKYSSTVSPIFTPTTVFTLSFLLHLVPHYYILPYPPSPTYPFCIHSPSIPRPLWFAKYLSSVHSTFPFLPLPPDSTLPFPPQPLLFPPSFRATCILHSSSTLNPLSTFSSVPH